jgi:hypothetical protein
MEGPFCDRPSRRTLLRAAEAPIAAQKCLSAPSDRREAEHAPGDGSFAHTCRAALAGLRPNAYCG